MNSISIDNGEGGAESAAYPVLPVSLVQESTLSLSGKINHVPEEALIMKERGKKVLALIPLDLDGFLLSDAYQSGKKSARAASPSGHASCILLSALSGNPAED